MKTLYSSPKSIWNIKTIENKVTIIYTTCLLIADRSNRDKRKEAAVHLQRMEEEMKQAEQKMAEDRKKREEEVPVKQEIATPGLATPRRTPQRLGL